MRLVSGRSWLLALLAVTSAVTVVYAPPALAAGPAPALASPSPDIIVPPQYNCTAAAYNAHPSGHYPGDFSASGKVTCNAVMESINWKQQIYYQAYNGFWLPLDSGTTDQCTNRATCSSNDHASSAIEGEDYYIGVLSGTFIVYGSSGPGPFNIASSPTAELVC